MEKERDCEIESGMEGGREKGGEKKKVMREGEHRDVGGDGGEGEDRVKGTQSALAIDLHTLQTATPQRRKTLVRNDAMSPRGDHALSNIVVPKSKESRVSHADIALLSLKPNLPLDPSVLPSHPPPPPSPPSPHPAVALSSLPPFALEGFAVKAAECVGDYLCIEWLMEGGCHGT